MFFKFKVCLILFSSFYWFTDIYAQNSVVKNYRKLDNGITVSLSDGNLQLLVMANNVVRVKFSKGKETLVPELVFIANPTKEKFTVNENASDIILKTSKISAIVNKQNGKLTFTDKSGKQFLSEMPGTRSLQPAEVQGEACFVAEQTFESGDDEYLFGLGQFQDGHFNLKNVSRRLTQVNSQIAIPFMYSSKGYGLLWHQYGLTDFNPCDNKIELTKNTQQAGSEQLIEVTTTSGTQKVAQNQSLYTGKITLPKDGKYVIFLELGDMGNRHFVAIDGKPIIDQSNMWLPPTVSAICDLKAGEHQFSLICKSDNKPALSWRLADNSTTFRSPQAQLLDYAVIYGPSADEVIATYRQLSGNAPMFPLWAYGFWQCRERYTSGKHLVETVKEFRKKELPLDVIVQDWQYWGNQGWGVPQFDTVNYPNPAGFIKELHDLNAHFNISIWSNPDKNSAIGKEFVAKNRFIPNTKWLDYFNPETRQDYWSVLNRNMFAQGVDSWWMDAVEPENDALKGEKTFAGIGEFYRLTYPLMVSRAVYEGQRKTSADKRVCILTRSAFSGQQRYGVINWSGDIGGTWDAYKRQIMAGLNFTMSGFPYWTTDIGGFFRPGAAQYADPQYHELLTRWFQWGALNPIFRIHGYMTETEPWKYGAEVEENMRKMLRLRYRLLPYIYSEAWQVTKNGSSLMRPLVMDFCSDTLAMNSRYAYMFGKNLLVVPVTEAGISQQKVYLPKSADWFDFWTGEKFAGGQQVIKETPMDILPLFVKAGTILPFGPKVQFTGEKKWDELEIRIYTGANAEFILYEDENDNYNYEKGSYSTIKFNWNEQEKSLTISNRERKFAGMLTGRKFNLVFVKKNSGVGIENAGTYDKTVVYNGQKVIVKQ
jgi:alpha-D-xyloside xylohydrolase